MRALIDSFAAWLATTPLPGYVNDHEWVWPICEILHFMGLCLLVGTVGMFDLRMLGMAKMLPLAPLYRLTRWGIAGFVVNLVTGIIFIIGSITYVTSNLDAVAFKLGAVFLAGLNLLLFHLTVSHKVTNLGAGEEVPLLAKAIATVSLFLWASVIWFGRRLMI